MRRILNDLYALQGRNQENDFPWEQTIKILNLEMCSSMLKDVDKLGS
jgi:hypothetical protein